MAKESKQPAENSCCAVCEHYIEENNSCPAFFPEGIPEAFLSGQEQHDSVVKGQKHNCIFTQKPPEL